MTKGKFIVVEGIDGCGKSTLIEKLKTHFPDAVFLREPTNGKFGITIRKKLSSKDVLDAKEMLSLFISDREEDCELNILPALNSGRNVIMDRYYYSNAAYQGAMGLDHKEIIAENINRGFAVPDIVLYLNISPEKALERIRLRALSSEQYEKLSFLEKVDSIYKKISDDRFCFLDGSLSPDEVLQQALEKLGDIL
ncbi:MAG: dTMP kinase [Spirochaetes bacterium]|nr:dTMP kinase [Spirochaetota bacterium]